MHILNQGGRLRDQEQASPDDDDSDDARDALCAWSEALQSNGGGRGSHRAQIHDPENQEDCRQAAAAMDAVKTETQTASRGGAGVRRQRTIASRRRPAAGG